VPVGVVHALQRRVHDMSLEMSAQVSSAVTALQDELMKLLQNQQEELHKLRLQQQCLQETLAVQFHRSRQDGDDQAVGQPFESKLRDLLGELHTTHKAEASSSDAKSVLRDLREEKALVAEMLDNVKQEKCEVIAMMHAFAMSKGEAIDELEGLRRVACEEAQAAANLVRRVVSSSGCSSRQPQEVPSTCRSAVRDTVTDEDRMLSTQTVLLGGRQGSRSNLTGTLQPQASAPMTLTSTGGHPPQAGGVTVMTMQHSQQPQQQSPQQQFSQPLTVIATTQSLMQGNPDHRRLSSGAVEPSLRRVCSPTRQYSAGGAGGLLPVSVACSPPLVPRPATAVETQKSPVRRFISAGLSPRVQDTLASSQGWGQISQATLIR